MPQKHILLALGIFLVIAVISAAFLLRFRVAEDTDRARLNVAASFYPAHYFVTSAAGERVQVFSVVPAGAEPHDFEPTSKDIAGIYAADLFVYNGGGFDAWAEKLRPEVEKAGVTVINLTETLLLETSGLRYENGGVDPHFWLDPSRAKEAITVIGETLKHLDPDGRPHYNAFVERAAARLDLLDRNYQETLGQCALSEIIVSHDAFRYLGHRYGFRTIAIAGFSPEEEPSLAQIAKLVELARAKGIRHIFFESLVSPKLSETIAREIGGSVLSLNPIEGLTDEGLHAGDDYVSLMRENLINLAAGLQCT